MQGQNQREAFGSTQNQHRIIKIGSDDVDHKIANRRVKDVEVCVPIAYGSISFHLGRKASETQTHKWTVYIRGATNENLGVVIKRVKFELHPSFKNPIRIVESPPFELSECGWGEFDIRITVYFHNDGCDKQVEFSHYLKLYPDDETGPHSNKKPIVVETYNEIVFPDPSEKFLARVQNHPAVVISKLGNAFELPASEPIHHTCETGTGDTKDHSLNQWFMNFSEADELLKLTGARQQVQAHIAKLKRQLSMIEGPSRESNPVTSYYDYK